MVAEPRLVARRRPAGLARGLRRSDRARGRAGRRHRARRSPSPATVDARRGRRLPGRMWCWVDDDRGRGRHPRRARSWSCRSPAVPATVLARDGRAAAPAAAPDGRVLFAFERDDALDVAETWADGAGLAAALVARRLRVGPDVLGRRPLGRVARVGPAAMPWTASRIVLVDRHVGAPRVVAGGPTCRSASRGSRPTARALAYVSDETGWWNVHVAAADGTGARPLLVEAARPRRAGVGSGPAFVRVVARRRDAIALCRNEDGFARLVVVGLDGAVTEVAKGWHHGIDWGPRGIVAVRSGGRTPPQVTVADPGRRRSHGWSRAARRRASRRGAREPEVVTWTSGDDDGHGLLYRPDDASRRRARRCSSTCTVDPPARPSCGGTAGCATSRAAGSRCCARTPAAPPAPAGRSSQDHARTWGEPTSPTSPPGSRRPAAPAGAIRRGGGDRRERRRPHGAARVRPPRVTWCAPRCRAYGVTDLFDLAADDPPVRVALPRRDRRGAPGRRRDRIATRSPVTHAAAIRVPLLVLQGDADRWCRPRRRSSSSTRCVPRAGPSSTTCTRARVTAGRDARPWRTSCERTWAFLERWVVRRMSGKLEFAYQGPKRGGRR